MADERGGSENVNTIVPSSSASLVALVAFAGIAAAAIVHVALYVMLGSAWPLVTALAVEALFVLVAAFAWRASLPAVLTVVAVAGFVLGFTSNYVGYSLYNTAYLVQAAIASLAVVLGTFFQIKHHIRVDAFNKSALSLLSVIVVVCVVCVGFWQANVYLAKSRGRIGHEIWDVPAVFETPAEHSGTLERITYDTKAYATDERTVTKAAYVYLPYGYDESKQYDILYLMHGTGDDEAYWLQTHEDNRYMVDQLIERNIIDPMIIVTPSFYVEDDYMDDLDQLTYSFASELRNDLMPVVESTYSTYAPTADDEGFAASRDHRAFAGLSRGAFTTVHSALCESLDYFSWFGAFSGTDTSGEEYKEAMERNGFEDLSINDLYVTTGPFDFLMPTQIRDVRSILEVDSRLRPGENMAFDVFPMRHHSNGSWHLALYNFLQRVFV